MIKKLLIFIAALVTPFVVEAEAFEIIKAEGWLESAYVKWTPKVDADSYNVYYSGEGVVDQKIDDQLIRSYGTYFRADVLGMAPGEYTIKVAPVISDAEGDAIVTDPFEVKGYDRTGFAFSNGRVPGAYKMDGTPKSGAVVLYITENTKNTISLNVTGANANPCIGLQEILDGFKKGGDNRPLIVRFVGQITDLDYMLSGDVVVENKNNASSYITLEGVGDDAVADGWGIRIKNATNIEIRNIGLMNCDSDEGDNIGLQQDNEYVWIHNCDFFYGNAGSAGDQQKGDGALDVKKSTYVTLSYNHFWDTGKTNLLGLGEGTTEGLYITYHHNWYDHSDSRHPRVRYYSAHVYNNYYDGIAKYGVGATNSASVFVEGNYFRNCKYPMEISMQGTDIFYGSPTFSSEDGGIIKAYNNYIEGAQRFVPYGDSEFTNSTVEFDAYVATTRNEEVPESVITKKGSNIYNNFDTDNSIMYSYTPDSPEDAKANVMQYAGRMFGGDFQWTFNNAVDDQSYAVNSALKTALTTYLTELVSIQGDGEAGGGGDDPGEINPGDEIHNFTLSGTNSRFYTISGNLSTSKGTVNYDGLTLTQCLKIESSTSITFTLTNTATLTLIFNESFGGKIKIDGINYTAENGVLTVDLEAGPHEITKGDSCNLYYMSLDLKTSTDISSNRLSSPISIYPNPVVNILTLSSTEGVEKVEVYGLSGKLLKSISVGLDQIELSDLNPGSYLIVIHVQNEVVKQLIIKR
ncbi:MAG TPA: T9SS type A sorting domain-containing protein [Marinilabiliaceae bacterium]|nr:T9SS type A sorting domain-containing protein [Marinilabiliaceae bacterium]